MKIAALLAVLLVLVPVALVSIPSTTAVPANTTASFASSPSLQWNQADGTPQGITSDGTYLYVTTSSTLARFDASGNKGCTISTSGDGTGGTNGAPAFKGATIYIPRKTGSGTSSATNVAMYGTSCIYLGEFSLGTGTIEAVTYHRGSYYAAWRNDATSDGYLRQYDESWNLINSWFLGNYDVSGSYSGANGIAFYGDFMFMPRHASSGGSYGVEVWQFPGGTSGPTKRFTASYPSWSNSAISRNEVGSQGIFIVDDFEDGATTPYAWVVGREASSGNGAGQGGIARFNLNVNLGTHSTSSPPVTYGTLQQVHDADDQHLQGIAVDDQNVFVIQSWEIERWTHAGSFVTLRNTSADLANLRLGGGTVEGDYLYIGGSNYPTLPRISWVLKYRTSDLALEDYQQTSGGSGEGGGVGYYGGSVYYLKDVGLTGELWLQKYDSASLAFQGQTYLGHYLGIQQQGIEFVSSGSTVWMYAPHHDPQDPYGRPGIHLWKSTNSGSSWTYQGAGAYTPWNNPDDLGGRTEINSQDIEFGCVGTTPYAWSVGRRDTDGAGYGAWVRHSISDPSGYVSCSAPATPNISASTNAHSGTGATAGSQWTFTGAPGATNVESSTYLKITNAGDAAGSVLVDLGASFSGPNGGSIPTTNNVVFLHAKATSPNNVVSWASLSGGASASATIPVPANCDVWIKYRINALPGILPDGPYTTSLTVSPQN